MYLELFRGLIRSNESVSLAGQPHTEGIRYSIDPCSEQSLVHVFLTAAHELTGCFLPPSQGLCTFS
jgi:hypothetical protein